MRCAAAWLAALAAAAAGAGAAVPVRRGVWAYFCYEDTASIDGSSPKGFYSAECWRQQSAAKAPAARGTLLMAKWRHVEPADGEFDWRALDANITAAAAQGLLLLLMVEICKADPADEATPAWLYGVAPGVNFTHGAPKPGETNPHRCPYYLDPVFQARFTRLIAGVAAHVAALPPASRAAVVGVQAAFGITGDDRPWNGVPINASLDISVDEWKAYTRKLALTYCSTFADLPVLFNLNNPGYNHSDDEWIVAQCPGAMVKQGIVSHGYQLNTELDLYNSWREQKLDGALSRGELAVEPNPKEGTYGNWAVSPQWSLQANAEWGLTFGLGIWNLYAGFLMNETFRPTMDFFNRHAPQTDVQAATGAFLSFRDSLNTEDTARFPEDVFGPVHLSHGHTDQLNGTRMVLIAESMAKYGARVDDANEARAQRSVVQKKGMFLNDVCYRCWEGNYRKFLRQVNTSATSVGRWRVGPVDEPYGRFARALEHSTGRTAIRLALDDGFAAARRGAGGGLNVTVRVVYLDEGGGRWTLGSPRGAALTVRKAGSGRWREAAAAVEVAAAPPPQKGYDFELRSLDAEDDVFSLVEVLVPDGR